MVAGDKIGIGGNSIGGGRAVRGAAMAPKLFNAVVALHVFAGGGFHHRPVTSPLMIVSGAEDNVAPPRDIKRIYDIATGPKMVGFVVGANHLNVPRFWYGPMTAFFLTHLAGDEEAERYSWGDEGLENSPRIIGGNHDCGGWRGVTSACLRRALL